MLPEFELLMPHSLQEALQILEEQPSVKPLAGGTNLVVEMRNGRHRPKQVMEINSLSELGGIRVNEDAVTIGSITTVADIHRDAWVAKHGICLQHAAANFANTLIANRATIGGNIADASPAADMAVPLLVLDAEVEILSARMKRVVKIPEFFLGVRKTALKPGELIGAVRWPLNLADSATAYYKLGLRKADAISVVSAAVMLESDTQGRCKQARIALGSVAPRPMRAVQAEELLKGQKITESLAAEAGKMAMQECSPISDIRASADYRRAMVGTLVKRLLQQAAGQLWK